MSDQGPRSRTSTSRAATRGNEDGPWSARAVGGTIAAWAGQCASETVAGRCWPSSGGQADVARGAMYSPRGRTFVVLPSTACGGTLAWGLLDQYHSDGVRRFDPAYDQVAADTALAAYIDRALGAERPGEVVRRPVCDHGRVVVGVDGSESSEAAPRWAVAEAAARGWAVEAIHAWEMAVPYDPAAYDVPAIEATARRMVDGMVDAVNGGRSAPDGAPPAA